MCFNKKKTLRAKIQKKKNFINDLIINKLNEENKTNINNFFEEREKLDDDNKYLAFS